MLQINKLHSIVTRWCGNSDKAWDLVSDAYCRLDRSRDEAEQAAFILKTCKGLLLNSYKVREIPDSELTVPYDDEKNTVLEELTARYDDVSEAQLIAQLAEHFDEKYRMELVVYLSFILFNREHESSGKFSQEAVRRVLRNAGYTRASAAAAAIAKYLLSLI